MPGEISKSNEGEPMCKCNHFKQVHDQSGKCTAKGCDCRKFTKIKFENSDLGKALDVWLRESK